MNDFLKILELKSIKEEQIRLSEKEKELSKPLLKDLSLISTIFEWYCELRGNCGLPERRDGSAFRQKFIFIILLLYSPNSLAGGKMARGIRDILAGILRVKTPSGISNNYSNVMDFYNIYEGYRKDMNYLYEEILNRLKIKGLIN